MLHFAKAARRCATYPLGRRVRRDQIGMLSLNGLKLIEQAIILSIRYGGLIQHVVIVIMLGDFLAQRDGAFGGRDVLSHG